MATLTLKQEMREMTSNLLGVLRENLLILASFIASIFSPALPMVVSVILFILLDTFTGLMKARYVKEKRNSNSMKRGLLPKVIIYTLCILVVFIADRYVLNAFVKHYFGFDFLITKVISLILIFVEIWSIDENFEAIFGHSLITYFKKFMNIFKDFLRNKLDNQSK
jgi:hypothetical protein